MLWENRSIECRFCHGSNGQGAWGPILAGRNLTVTQFQHAVREPMVMPAYVETQVTDNELADIVAYLNSLPAPAQRGPWRTPLPEDAAAGARAAITTVGCAQCHGAVFASPRQAMGAVNGDFEWFKRVTYEHTTAMPDYWKATDQPPRDRMRMGNYSPATLDESILREIYDWARDLGVRAPVTGRLTAGVRTGDGVTYTLNLDNAGAAGKGVPAEGLTISLVVPSGTAVLSAAGPGYQGVRHNEQSNRDMALWKITRLAAAEHQTLTLKLSAAATAENNLRGTITWMRPAVKTGPVDNANIAPAPMASKR